MATPVRPRTSLYVPEPTKRYVPPAVMLIAVFQFAKAAFLLIVSLMLWVAPEALPHTEGFEQLLYVAAHGRSVSGVLVPVFGCYVAYVGWGLVRLRKRVRRNLAISSALTIGLSLQRLGVFGDTDMHGQLDRQTLYILILLDLMVYIYLTFHPDITKAFTRE
jgi:hypothetical protein